MEQQPKSRRSPPLKLILQPAEVVTSNGARNRDVTRSSLDPMLRHLTHRRLLMSTPANKPRIILVAGATGTGKSRVRVALVRKGSNINGFFSWLSRWPKSITARSSMETRCRCIRGFLLRRTNFRSRTGNPYLTTYSSVSNGTRIRGQWANM